MATTHAPIHQFLHAGGELIAARIENYDYTAWCRVEWSQYQTELLPTFPYGTEPGIEPWAGRWRVISPLAGPADFAERQQEEARERAYRDMIDGAAREQYLNAALYPGTAASSARAWTLLAFVTELDAPPVAQPYPLCPTCNGIGYVETDPLPVPADCPPEYDIADCPSCAGIGTLAPPLGWPVAEASL